MEEGELSEQPGSYDSSLEWPGADGALLDPSHDTPADLESASEPSKHTFLRLVVHKTSVLSPRRKIAIVDGFTELQFGRDAAIQGSTTPRVRLKEMEVSKLHATIFWDGLRKEWNIVDMGSKHGTFVFQGESNISKLDAKSRLSAPRMSSIPRRIAHGDSIFVGGTAFIVHIHNNHLPCDECSASSTNAEIPLFSTSSTSNASALPPAPALQPKITDPKAALISLKRSLLTQHSGPSQQTGLTDYVDRSAKRRALHPGSSLDSPGVLIPPSVTPDRVYNHAATPLTTPAPLPPPQSKSIDEALPQTNIGHRLLMKQGWMPGEALGHLDDAGSSGQDGRLRLIEPLKISAGVDRAGLGMTKNTEGESDIGRAMITRSSDSWRESSRQRRWDNAQR